MNDLFTMLMQRRMQQPQGEQAPPTPPQGALQMPSMAPDESSTAGMPPQMNTLPWMPKGPSMQGAPVGGTPVLPNITPRLPTRAQRWDNGQQLQSAYANGWNPNPTMLGAILRK